MASTKRLIGRIPTSSSMWDATQKGSVTQTEIKHRKMATSSYLVRDNREAIELSKRKNKMVGLRGREGVGEKSDKITEVVESEQLLQSALSMFVKAKEAENLRSSTIREYINHIRYLTEYFVKVRHIERVDLSVLTGENIVAYINYLAKDKKRYSDVTGRQDKTVGLSPSTINIRLRTLRTMCSFWHGEGLLEVNPMRTIKQLRHDEDDKVPGLTDSELALLFGSYDERQYADWRDRILCLLILDTGLRPTEAVELPINRIDFPTLTISVTADVAKGRYARNVPMSNDIARLLRSLIAETSDYFGDVEQVFMSSYGEELTADSFRKRLNRRKVKLGFKRLSPNQFRHTFCRNYILNGGDLFTLQKIVGHRDIHTTRKYIQMDFEHIESQHESFSPAKRILNRL